MNQSVPVFRSQFLAANQKINSSAVNSLGNKVVLTVTIINIAASSTCSFYVDGSYDGVSWTENIASALDATAFGVPTPASKSTLDYAFVRVRVSTTGATLFDATLAFSEQ